MVGVFMGLAVFAEFFHWSVPISLSLSSGLVHDNLKVFLLNNVPQGKKKSKVQLGVSDPKLGSIVHETLGISCQSGEPCVH